MMLSVVSAAICRATGKSDTGDILKRIRQKERDEMESMQDKRSIIYQQKVQAQMPKSNALQQCVRAFVVGGLICCLGQFLNDIGKMYFNLTEKNAGTFTCIVLIFIGATLTGIGVYDKIGAFAGAGSVVPITGFSNSIVSPAMEFKREGYVLGVGAKLFSVAGPVLVYGISASVIVGLVACLFMK